MISLGISVPHKCDGHSTEKSGSSSYADQESVTPKTTSNQLVSTTTQLSFYKGDLRPMCIIVSAARLISKKYKLTPRETDILVAIVEIGPDRNGLAERYSLTPATAYKYVKNIYDKTDSKGMGELLHLIMKEASYFDTYSGKDEAERKDLII